MGVSESSKTTSVMENIIDRHESEHARSAAEIAASSDTVSDAPPAWTRYTNIPFRLLGYGILMGWHFLLLYFLVMPANSAPDSSILFFRQMALNGSLAFTFALLALLGNKDMLPSNLFLTSRIAVVSLLAASATAGAMYAALNTSFVPMILCTIIAGSTEAVLIIAWLHYYSEASNDYATQYIALSLVIGATVTFFTHHLTMELGLICFIALPILSAIMLVGSVQQTPIRSLANGERGVQDRKGAMRPLIGSTLYLAIYGAIFGFLQGSMLPNGDPILAIFSPNTVIGAGLAGALAAFAYHKAPGKHTTEMLRRVALMLFIVGILLTSYPSNIAKNCAGILIMTGFITAEIVVLVFVVRLIRAYDLNSFFAIGLNRGIQYAAFACAIAAGATLAQVIGNAPYYTMTVSALSVVAILGYTLLSMGEGKMDWIHQLYVHDETDHEVVEHSDSEKITESAPVEGRWKTKCRAICQRSGLSPRESEVFLLMAKGRNAEYIQGALVISGYTAKTHIANIYRKVGVHSLQELIDTVEQADMESSDVLPVH